MLLANSLQAYEARTGRSRQIYELARRLLPGEVSGNAKFLKPHPLYVEKASGSRNIDVDGNSYIDLLYGGGPAILGHSPPAVTRAVAEQLEKAVSPIFATELEVRLAEKATRHMPYMEMMRFVNSQAAVGCNGEDLQLGRLFREPDKYESGRCNDRRAGAARYL